MAVGKNLWHKKWFSSKYLTITICIFIAFFLIAIWVLRSPSEFSRGVNVELVNANVATKDASDKSSVRKSAKGAVGDDNFDENGSANIWDGQQLYGDKADISDNDKGEVSNSASTKYGKASSEEKIESERQKLDDLHDQAEGESGDQEIKKGHAEEATEFEPSKNGTERIGEDRNESDPQKQYKVDSFSDKTLEDGKDRISETLPLVSQSELTKENNESSESWATQAKESVAEQNLNSTTVSEDESSEQSEDAPQHDPDSNSNDLRKTNKSPDVPGLNGEETFKNSMQYKWKLCKWSGAVDYIPCLQNKKAIKRLKSRRRFEHRERHCPTEDGLTTCLVPLPDGYKSPIRWPKSRDEIWFSNVPHPKLISYKQDQNWMTRSDDRLLFPGGGTQFKDGALLYINYIEEILPEISWGKHTRVVLDVGCGVASFGGYLFDKDVLTMSFAPNDEHEAQVQLALERGIPAFLSVMGTQRLVFPSNVYDVAHCARCRVHWHADGAKLLLEINRVLRPGGYFVWSATPVYRTEPEEVHAWKEVETAASGMRWSLVAKKTNPQTGVGVAIFQKPKDSSFFEEKAKEEIPFCEAEDNADAAWYVPMTRCLHKLPENSSIHGAEWPRDWPIRLEVSPTWLNAIPKGLYGREAAEEFQSDNVHWKHIIEKSYLRGIGIKWEDIRNVMDMKAGYGGFAAALAGLPVWVMNVIPIDEPDTLPIIFDRGLIGVYHDWCESFNTYPRTYDLVHADHLFGKLYNRCNILKTLVEMDRILRPDGWIIFRDRSAVLDLIEPIAKSLHWDIQVSYTQEHEQLLVVRKQMWRPSE